MLGVYSDDPDPIGGGVSEEDGSGGEIEAEIQSISFDDVLNRAAYMGLNLQSDEFWELRPDNFKRMSEAFALREEKEQLGMQRVLFLVAKGLGMESIENPSDLLPLPKLDELAERASKEVNKPIILSKEEIAEKEKWFRENILNNK